jgi:DNA-binding transcriptional regulator YiaG
MKKLLVPTIEEIKNARENAGDGQAEAAARVHSPSYRSWQDWEAGRRQMPLERWELYILKTGQEDLLKYE